MSGGELRLALIADHEAGAVGAAWGSAGEEAGLLVAAGAADSASAELSNEEHGVGLRIGTGSASVLGTLHPATQPIALEGGDGPGRGLNVAPASGRFTLSADSSTAELTARGALCALAPPDADSRLRLVALIRSDGALLIAASAGSAGSTHDEERAMAWGIAPNGELNPFPTALISTEYDGEGSHTRVGLELWPGSDDDEAMPLRAAATLLPNASVAGEPAAALMRGSAEGQEMLGIYLLGGERPPAGG